MINLTKTVLFPFETEGLYSIAVVNRPEGMCDSTRSEVTNRLNPPEVLWSQIGPRGDELHYTAVIMGAIAFQITSLTIVYSTVYSDANQRKHQSSVSLAFVRGIHRGPVNSPHEMASNAENVSIWWRHDAIYASVTKSSFHIVFSIFHVRGVTAITKENICSTYKPVNLGCSICARPPVTFEWNRKDLLVSHISYYICHALKKPQVQ